MTSEKVTIEIGAPDGPKFKSIQHVIWDDVPPFSILTGRNGVGKSQLLELLAIKLTRADQQLGDIRSIGLRIQSLELQPDEVVHIPSNWVMGGVAPVSVSELRAVRQQFLGGQHYGPDINSQRLQSKRNRLMQAGDAAKRINDDISFLIDEANVSSAISHVFVEYRFKTLRGLERGKSDDDLRRLHGIPPWEILNEILENADFPYCVNNPIGTELWDHFTVKLSSKSGEEIYLHDLSSGEQAILQVILWLFYSQNHGIFPKLLLVDEPDAHLHPAMTRQFLSVIIDVLVKKYGVRVILATHSPSTVALAPEGSVFEMKRGCNRIEPCPTNQYAIGLLTAGLVTVGPGTRFCFVEDHDDVAFYNCIRDLLADFGPSRTEYSLAPAPAIVFLPASAGKGKNKIPGGCKVVKEWVSRFTTSGLGDAFCGLIDGDGSNRSKDGVFAIKRYCFENYLLDPIAVFTALLQTEKAIDIPGLNIKVGDENQIANLPEERLQEIANTVLSMVDGSWVDDARKQDKRSAVTFTSGVILNYPKWLLEESGKDYVYPKFRDAFGADYITQNALRLAHQRTRLIPVDLAQTLRDVQALSVAPQAGEMKPCSTLLAS